MISAELWAEQLYDGTGRHHVDAYPPLMVENQLTADFAKEKALRPYASGLAIEPEHGNNLALVWMAPLGLKLGVPSCNFRGVVGALVQAVDAGGGILVHADDAETAGFGTGVVLRFKGGGHA